jgi:CheY-like chemotaxis protein
MAMMHVKEEDPLYADLKQIHLVAGTAANITRQLLLFSRKQPVELISLNINRTIKTMLEMFKAFMGENVSISTEQEANLSTVEADKGNMEQVIMNLVVNAREAMPNGGKITIKTENVALSGEDCKGIPEARPGKFVCLSVIDTGVGMEKAVIPNIFEAFFTTKGDGKGTGLGLSVVYGIIKRHNGWISLCSEPGQGSIFKVYLPASSAKPETETKEAIPLGELQGSGEGILLVEDREEARKLVTRGLRKNGYVVFEAASAEEAEDVFEREKGNLDVLFTDVILPDKSGLQLADQLLSHKPDFRVLLSSGFIGDKDEWSFIRQRGLRFLQKPYTLVELLRAISEVTASSKIKVSSEIP